MSGKKVRNQGNLEDVSFRESYENRSLQGLVSRLQDNWFEFR